MHKFATFKKFTPSANKRACTAAAAARSVACFRAQEIQTAKENVQGSAVFPLPFCLLQTVCFSVSTMVEKLKQAEQRDSQLEQ